MNGFLNGVLIGYLVVYTAWLVQKRRQVQRVVNDPSKWN